MARFYSLIALTLILSSCAQVGNITGGEKDVFAPSPIEKSVSPPNESVSFSAKKVVIPFNEFIKLSNPLKNIVMVPPHATIDASVKGKTLTLEWEEDLKAETTYSIYLNGAVKDITEGNDSIIQYVFSTGSTIDSLTYGTYVMDAVGLQPVKDVTVALFDKTTDEIINFGQTNSNGFAQLNYLKAGDYKLAVFEDSNKDLAYSKGESTAFKSEGDISINQSLIDSIPFKLFKPKSEPKLRTIKYIPPSSIVFGSNANFQNESILIDGIKLNSDAYRKIKPDSIIAFVNDLEPKSLEVIFICDAFTDTSSIRISSQGIETQISVKFRGAGKELAPSDSVFFVTNDKVKDLDISKIKLYNPQDSIKITDYTVSFASNIISFELPNDSISDVVFEFSEGAIASKNSSSTFHTTRLTFNPLRKYGIINVDLSAYKKPVVLEVYKAGKKVKSIAETNTSKQMVLAEVIPGKYTFRVIRDENSNGKWDTGNLEEFLQPEQVDHYSKEIDVRANWEINVPLVPAL